MKKVLITLSDETHAKLKRIQKTLGAENLDTAVELIIEHSLKAAPHR